jgi:lipoprotein-anchoring transpeptidase ErfK/SrfK
MRQDVPQLQNGALGMVGMRRTLVAVVVAVIAPLALIGRDDGRSSAWAGPAVAAPSGPGADAGTGRQVEVATVPISLSVTPARDRKNVPVSAEVGLRVSGAEVTSVTLTDSKGKTVPGALRDDRSAWVPGKTLKPEEKYAASVVATSASGLTKTVATTFTTMGAPGRRTGTGLYLFDDHTYGVGMPVVVEFSPGVPKSARAAVQKRMFVRTDPPQPGAWSWTTGGTQAYYRGPRFWQPGTKLTVRIGVGGLPTGGGRYGDRDRSATATIGRSFIMRVDNATKKMTVEQNGKVVRTAPVSLGKASTPSSSGTMVVMDKLARTVFDTRAELGPEKGYRVDIEYAQRLTWSGQYIHSAPWSVGSQGRRNVSHGCVNVSPSQARWLFAKTLIGDPVIVKGTRDKLDYGNGWTAWNVSWAKFLKGSALPVPDALRSLG